MCVLYDVCECVSRVLTSLSAIVIISRRSRVVAREINANFYSISILRSLDDKIPHPVIYSKPCRPELVCVLSEKQLVPYLKHLTFDIPDSN